MIKHLLILLLLLSSLASTQDFVFVSSRIQVETDLSEAEEWEKQQNELYMYKDSSEIRLTNTNDLNEYDPSISPNGKLIAYVANSWVYPIELEASSWQLIVSDLHGKQIAQFPLANSQSEMRPAGGYTISWASDSNSLFTNISDENYDWDVYHFDLKTKNTKKVAEGFMPILSPDNKLLATYLDGEVRVYDLSLDESWSIIEGVPLAWYDNNSLIIEDGYSLRLIDAYTAEIIDDLYTGEGVYEYFSINEVGEFIFALRQPNRSTGGSSLHKFINKYDSVLEVQFEDVITGLSFLADGNLVYSLQSGYSDQIYKINDHGTISPLVSSFGTNYHPQGFKK